LPGVHATELVVDRAVLPDHVTVGARVVCADGRVQRIDTQAGGAGAGRLRGTLLPGLVDLQVNGAGGHSVDEATGAALDAIARAVWDGGAVAFLPTLITAPWERLLAQVDAVARWCATWRDVGAEPLGLHVEGPFLEVGGAHDPACFVDPTPQRIDALLAAARGRLRLVTLASSRPGAADAVRRLRAAGVAVALGHVAATAGFADCVAAGAGMVTHLFNAMGPLHHREPGIAGLALDDARLAAGLIADGAHVHEAMLRNALRILGPDRMVLVTDAVAAAGMPDGEFTLQGMRVRSQAGVVRDARGVLAGSALTMAQAARNFLRFCPEAGIWTLARVAATNAARLLAADDYGVLAPGRRAAFTLLGDDGAAHCVRA
jgi:N-acetylglucosamine-6-phosphate deacetylase